MSYSDFLKSTSNPERSNSASPAPVIHRKPPPSYTALPINTSPGTVYKTVTQYNNLRSASMSSYSPSTNPSISNGSHSHSPLPAGSPSTMKSSADPVFPLPPSTPHRSLPNHNSTPTTTPTPTSKSKLTTNPPNPPPPPRTSPPPPPPSTNTNPWDAALQTCLALQTDATTHHNKRPFAALLLAPNNTTVLHTHFSISHVQHAECELARLATIHYSPQYLRHCTLVSTWEPCAMCAATIYWSRIGRVVYAASEKSLRDLTGIGNGENLTMDLPCRDVFAAGQTNIEVVGPVPGWEEKVVEESRKWWKRHAVMVNGKNTTAGTRSASAAVGNAAGGVVTNPVPDEGVSSRIGEDGEYKADLKVDWMMR